MRTFFIIVVVALVVLSVFVLYDLYYPNGINPAPVNNTNIYQNNTQPPVAEPPVAPGTATTPPASTGTGSGTNQGTGTNQVEGSQTMAGKMYTIEYKEGAFSPTTLNIKKGDTVTWVNHGTSGIWPASAIHPTHTVYPGSDIEKCGTSEQPNIFDACRALQPGESWSFKFNSVGSWRYHNHMQANQTGVINVTE